MEMHYGVMHIILKHVISNSHILFNVKLQSFVDGVLRFYVNNIAEVYIMIVSHYMKKFVFKSIIKTESFFKFSVCFSIENFYCTGLFEYVAKD